MTVSFGLKWIVVVSSFLSTLVSLGAGLMVYFQTLEQMREQVDHSSNALTKNYARRIDDYFGQAVAAAEAMLWKAVYDPPSKYRDFEEWSYDVQNAQVGIVSGTSLRGVVLTLVNPNVTDCPVDMSDGYLPRCYASLDRPGAVQATAVYRLPDGDKQVWAMSWAQSNSSKPSELGPMWHDHVIDVEAGSRSPELSLSPSTQAAGLMRNRGKGGTDAPFQFGRMNFDRTYAIYFQIALYDMGGRTMFSGYRAAVDKFMETEQLQAILVEDQIPGSTSVLYNTGRGNTVMALSQLSLPPLKASCWDSCPERICPTVVGLQGVDDAGECFLSLGELGATLAGAASFGVGYGVRDLDGSTLDIRQRVPAKDGVETTDEVTTTLAFDSGEYFVWVRQLDGNPYSVHLQLLWVYPVAEMQKQMQSALVTLIVIIVVILVFDILMIAVEYVVVVIPLRSLSEACVGITNMQTEQVQVSLLAVLSKTIVVSEVKTLAKTLLHAMHGLTELRSLLPYGTILDKDDNDESDGSEAPGKGNESKKPSVGSRASRGSLESGSQVTQSGVSATDDRRLALGLAPTDAGVLVLAMRQGWDEEGKWGVLLSMVARCGMKVGLGTGGPLRGNEVCVYARGRPSTVCLTLVRLGCEATKSVASRGYVGYQTSVRVGYIGCQHQKFACVAGEVQAAVEVVGRVKYTGLLVSAKVHSRVASNCQAWPVGRMLLGKSEETVYSLASFSEAAEQSEWMYEIESGADNDVRGAMEKYFKGQVAEKPAIDPKKLLPGEGEWYIKCGRVLLDLTHPELVDFTS